MDPIVVYVDAEGDDRRKQTTERDRIPRASGPEFVDLTESSKRLCQRFDYVWIDCPGWRADLDILEQDLLRQPKSFRRCLAAIGLTLIRELLSFLSH